MYDFMGKNAKSTSFNFCCANDFYHYRMWYPHWENLCKIYYDQVEVYDERYRHIIQQVYTTGVTNIEMMKVNSERHPIDEVENKNFRYDQLLFDWQKTSYGKIINRLKILLTFR